MSKVTIPPSTWYIDRSYKVRVDVKEIRVQSLDDLRQQVQAFADSYIATDEHPPLGELIFRYELDGNDEVDVVFAYFESKNNQLLRFMVLELV